MSFEKLHPSIESLKQYVKVREFKRIKTLYLDLEEIEIPLVAWHRDDIETQVKIGSELFDLIVQEICITQIAENKLIDNIERYKNGEEYGYGDEHEVRKMWIVRREW